MFFRMITAAPQNHLTQENAICDPKHTKHPSPPQNINAYYRNRMYDPKTPDMWAKTPPRRHKTKHVFYQNTTASSITYGFFRRNTLFSACITEKCNTEYSTEHKLQGEQTGLKRTDPYTTLIASAPFPMRPRKKNAIPICRTDMPDRNNKKRTFERPLIDFQLKTCCKKHGIFAPNTQTNRNLPQKNTNIMRLFQRLFFYYRHNHLLFPHKTAPPQWNTVKQTKNHRKFV